MGDTDERYRHSGTLGVLSFSISGLLLVACMSAVSAARPVRYIVPLFLETPTNITALEGTDAILPCSVKNLGTKSVTWKKVTIPNPLTIGEFVFDPDKRYDIVREDDDRCAFYPERDNPCWNLRIRSVGPEHAGTYECQISTKEDYHRKVNLRVVEDESARGRKRMTGIKLNGTSYVEVGASIDLNCTALAIDYRPKGVDWFKDGSRIKSGSRTVITEFILSRTNVLHSRLQIDRAKLTDAGTYVCRFSQENVDSLKVIVLNTNSSNQRRESPQEKGYARFDHEANEKDGSSSDAPSYAALLLMAVVTCQVSRHSL